MKSTVLLVRVAGISILLASSVSFAQCVDNSLNAILPDAYEPDETPQLAAALPLVPITNPMCQSHSIAPAGDQDWFVFQASTEQTYRVSVRGFSADLNPRVSLVAQDGVTVLFSSDINMVCSQLIDCDFALPNIDPTLTNGAYFLVIDDPNPGATGNYDIYLTLPVGAPSVLVKGSVTDQAGHAIGGAVVTALDNSSQNAITNAGVSTKATDGYLYQMSVPPPANNTIKVVVTASGYTQTSPPVVTLPSSSNPPPVFQNLTMQANVVASTPIATALSATGTGPTSEKLQGSVLTNGASTTASFSYRQGTSGSWNALTGSQTMLSQAASGQAVSANAPLTCATSYQFEVDATNTAGSSSSPPITFTTEACPQPSFTSLTATAQPAPPSVCPSGNCSVDFSTSVNSSGSPSTKVEIQFQQSSASFWNTVGVTTVNSPTIVDNFTQSDLRCDTDYRVQALAQDSGANSWVYRAPITFTTGSCPAPEVSSLQLTNLRNGVCSSADIGDYSAETTLDINVSPSPRSDGLPTVQELTVPANTTSVHHDFFIAGISCGTLYTFTFALSNQYGSASAQKSISTPACTDTIFADGFDVPVICTQ